MKKLFSIFCCLLLSASMVTQAQELLAPKKQAHPLVLKSANAPTKAPTATNRHNAPQDYDWENAFSWDDYMGTFYNQSGTSYRYVGYRWTWQVKEQLDVFFVFATTNGRYLSTIGRYFPKNGTYQVKKNPAAGTKGNYIVGGPNGLCVASNYNGCVEGYSSSYSIWGPSIGSDWDAEWYEWAINSGTMWIQDGAKDMPYVEADFTWDGGISSFITIGSLFGFDLQATNGSIDMVDNDDNAHYYSNDQHYGFNAGTSATLTANPNPGYEFDHWEYNGANLSTDNPIDWTVASGDDTYNGNTDGYIHLTAVFRAAASGVDVTLNSNGGSNNNQVVSATNGSAMPTTLKAGGAIAKPSRSGYTFGGYYANNDGTGKQYYTATLTSANNWDKTVATTIYAKWTQTVTLNANTANHGSGSNRSATATVNGTALSSFTATTAASGYTLEGYYTDATSGTKVLNANGTYAANNVTNYITSGKWTKTGATTLYAHMTAHTYNVVFNGNGSTGGSMSNQLHTYGASQNLTANAFTRTGYTFRGWATSQANADAGTVTYTDGQSVSNLTTTNNGTYNLYAVWKANTYKVVFNANYGSGTMDDQAFTYDTPQKLTTNAFTRTGHTFQGWATSADRANAGTVDYTDGQSVSNLTTTNNGTFNLYAVWTELVTFTIADYTNGTVTVTPNDGSGAFTTGSRDLAVGTMVTLNFAAAEHYHISYVTLKGNQFTDGTAYTLRAGDGTVTLIADFLPDTYTITYNLNGGTNPVSPAPATGYNIETADITLPTPTKEGYTFDGWYANEELTGSPVTTIAQGSYGNKEFWAKWTENITYYTLNISAGDNGSVNTAVNGQKEAGTKVTIEATPKNSFYAFTRWSDDNTENPREITMNSDVTLSASFAIADPMPLNDNEGAAYYTAYDALSENTGVNVQLMRTLNADTWSTICLPFDYKTEDEDGRKYDGQFYEFKGASGDYASGLNLYFSPAGSVEANVPYLFRSSSKYVNPVFSNATLHERSAQSAGEITYGNVRFQGTAAPEMLNDAGGHTILGLIDNKVYYPNLTSGTLIRAFRAYFVVGGLPAGVQPRVRIVVSDNNATAIDVIETDGADGMSAPEVRKYMENGILIIERNGVKYNAEGAVVR